MWPKSTPPILKSFLRFPWNFDFLWGGGRSVLVGSLERLLFSICSTRWFLNVFAASPWCAQSTNLTLFLRNRLIWAPVRFVRRPMSQIPQPAYLVNTAPSMRLPANICGPWQRLFFVLGATFMFLSFPRICPSADFVLDVKACVCAENSFFVFFPPPPPSQRSRNVCSAEFKASVVFF